MTGAGLRVYDTAEELAAAAAGLFADLAAAEVEAKGVFTAALSGGSTPGMTYDALAGPDRAGRVPWQGVHLFWGDERCVGPDDPESNFAMARERLISRVDIPGENIHRMRGEDHPAASARRYEEELTGFFTSLGPPGSAPGTGVPALDLVFLGLGADCHTLSLFPGTAALEETERLVVENYIPRLGSWRLTMTPRLVGAAGSAVFLVSGGGKAEALVRALGGGEGDCPARLIRSSRLDPDNDWPLWLVDRAAARLL
ncbi:MAG: 6-phosphogluconolactonase [Thermodesulfobacteriota bacterium]